MRTYTETKEILINRMKGAISSLDMYVNDLNNGNMSLSEFRLLVYQLKDESSSWFNEVIWSNTDWRK